MGNTQTKSKEEEELLSATLNRISIQLNETIDDIVEEKEWRELIMKAKTTASAIEIEGLNMDEQVELQMLKERSREVLKEIQREGSKMDINKQMVQEFLQEEIAFEKKINDRKRKIHDEKGGNEAKKPKIEPKITGSDSGKRKPKSKRKSKSERKKSKSKSKRKNKKNLKD